MYYATVDVMIKILEGLSISSRNSKEDGVCILDILGSRPTDYVSKTFDGTPYIYILSLSK